ncbi:hypothetical protein ARHIZOSPH14_29890 [Agromyces rhizosphaerae]|uniref:Uncharacterized protein n=1 Tax=Agromyces rhizosphaerae TaxID=88374 RepID=A0A9W6D0U7_9MICO|nr:hypothetical protein [Agromyces rhizosphaerae]GLI28747.1 hypothetical protein ARHIZOSPH14_29890 [Agromyces rhizosphaerae]
MRTIDEETVVSTGDDGEPRRLVWRQVRYRVSDRPTALVGTCPWWRPLADTGVRGPLDVTGWRFQGTADDGSGSLVFDVVLDPATLRWSVVGTYD